MKSLAALLTSLIVVTTMLASAAEAGFKVRLGFGGPLPAFTAYGNSGGSYYGRKHREKRAYHAARRRERESVRVSRKAAPEPKVAKVDEPKKVEMPVQSAESENSSIATGTRTASTETSETKEQVAAVKEEVGCKKFFPSVGMTLSVPCE